jgi:hypothetical protein
MWRWPPPVYTVEYMMVRSRLTLGNASASSLSVHLASVGFAGCALLRYYSTFLYWQWTIKQPRNGASDGLLCTVCAHIIGPIFAGLCIGTLELANPLSTIFVDELRNQTGHGAQALRLTNRYDVPITVLRASLVSGNVFEVFIAQPPITAVFPPSIITFGPCDNLICAL